MTLNTLDKRIPKSKSYLSLSRHYSKKRPQISGLTKGLIPNNERFFFFFLKPYRIYIQLDISIEEKFTEAKINFLSK
jgi:hypothetical protein